MKLDNNTILDIFVVLFLMFCVGCCTSLAHHRMNIDATSDVVLNDTIK